MTRGRSPRGGASRGGTPGGGASRGGASRGGASRGGTPRGETPTRQSADVHRLFEAPASAVFSAITDPARRGWAPSSLFRLVSVLAPRFVRLAFPDGSLVAISITRQGNTRCGVGVDITQPASGGETNAMRERERERWRGALAALAEQLDHDWA